MSIRATGLALCLGLLPGAVLAADWWVGNWAFDPQWCAVADRIGSVTPAPIAITATEIRGYENSCQISSARPMDGVGAVHLTLQCQSEGSTYEEERLILRQSDTQIWIWWGGDAPSQFQKCVN